MPDKYVISDTHFGHKNICKFKAYDGCGYMRPFSSVDEMDEAMVKNWNETVSPKDTIYHLGDVVMNRKNLEILSRLNGHKILIKGNHDTLHLSEYAQYFSDIMGVYTKSDYVLSHIPLHGGCLNRFKLNIHGHLHDDFIRLKNGEPDPRYICVSVEQTNYKPVLLETLLNRR